MFPAHHDITENNLLNATATIQMLLASGHSVLIVSKPRVKVIAALCDSLRAFDKELIEFRFSIGSASQEILSYWEPYAPRLTMRQACLAIANANGFKTSVSCEPMLDILPESVVSLVESWVTETIWIGLPNFLASRLALNGQRDDVKAMGRQLMASFTDEVVARIYANLKDDPKIRWKDSMRKRLKLETGNLKQSEQKTAPKVNRGAEGFGSKGAK